MKLRPNPGGFARPIGCGIFIRDFLLGISPLGRPEIDPEKGAATQDIFYHYKVALHTAYAEEAVDRENRRRIKAGKPIYSPEEYAERVDWHLRRLPYKLVKSRYHSFQRYFHWLKQLEWVEATGEEERSSMQEATDDHPDTYPRKLYRLTRKGIEASDEDWAHPQRVLYPQIGDMPMEDYFKEKRQGRKYIRPRKEMRFLRPFTAGQFLRDYLMGLGPEGSPRIDPDEGDYSESIFYHYKEALRLAYAKDTAAWENEQRIRKKQEPFTAEEYAERLEWHLERIPYKLHRARFHSFYRYFHYLKQLGWIEPTGREEESYIQNLKYAAAPPRRYYRLSAKGKGAPEWEWYRPQLTLYPEFTTEYFAQMNRESRHKANASQPTHSHAR
jgi:DNA-binding PadR family transcriptional regulator